MNGGYAELLGELERCERRLAETRRRFVYNEGRAETPPHAELLKLEAELRRGADRLHELCHRHAPASASG